MKTFLTILIAGLLLVSCASDRKVIRESYTKCGPCEDIAYKLQEYRETVNLGLHIFPEIKAAGLADNAGSFEKAQYKIFKTNLEILLIEEGIYTKKYDSCVISNKRHYRKTPSYRLNIKQVKD